MIDEKEMRARRRFAMISFARLFAIIIAFVGAANIGGRLMPDLSPLLGKILLAVAAFLFFALPAFLKRAWRSRE
ncbi:MAG: hypothetical protein ACKVOJ_05790 [Sphingomonadaceae bacterium]